MATTTEHPSDRSEDAELPRRVEEAIVRGAWNDLGQRQRFANGVAYCRSLQERNREKSPRIVPVMGRMADTLHALSEGRFGTFEGSDVRETSRIVAVSLDESSPGAEIRGVKELGARLGGEFVRLAEARDVVDIVPFLAFVRMFARRWLGAFPQSPDSETAERSARMSRVLGHGIADAISRLLRARLEGLETPEARDEYLCRAFADIADAKIFRSESEAFLQIMNMPAHAKKTPIGVFARASLPDVDLPNLATLSRFLSDLFEADLEPMLRLAMSQVGSFAMSRMLTGVHVPPPDVCWERIQEASELMERAVRRRPSGGAYRIDCLDLFGGSFGIKPERAILTVDGTLENLLSLELRFGGTDRSEGWIGSASFRSLDDARKAAAALQGTRDKKRPLFSANPKTRSLDRVFEETLDIDIALAGIDDADSRNEQDFRQLVNGALLYRLAAQALAMHLSKESTIRLAAKHPKGQPAKKREDLPTHTVRRTDRITYGPETPNEPEAPAVPGQSVQGTIRWVQKEALPRLPAGQFPSREAYERGSGLGLELYVFLVPLAIDGSADDADTVERETLHFSLLGIGYDSLREYVEFLKKREEEKWPFAVRVHTYRRPIDRRQEKDGTNPA